MWKGFTPPQFCLRAGGGSGGGGFDSGDTPVLEGEFLALQPDDRPRIDSASGNAFRGAERIDRCPNDRVEPIGRARGRTQQIVRQDEPPIPEPPPALPPLPAAKIVPRVKEPPAPTKKARPVKEPVEPPPSLPPPHLGIALWTWASC